MGLHEHGVEIESIARSLRDLAAQFDALEPFVRTISDTANEIGKAHCGSWLGYFSRVYYSAFTPVPPGARFDAQWGFNRLGRSVGDWQEFPWDEVHDAIVASVNKEKFQELHALSAAARERFEALHGSAISLFSLIIEETNDSYMKSLVEKCIAVKLISAQQLVRAMQPSGKFLLGDPAVLSEGIVPPPHTAVLAEMVALESPFKKMKELAKLCSSASVHLFRRLGVAGKTKVPTVQKVFIGHGRSLVWRELKDFVCDSLKLPWDEFNRVPIAGVGNIQRLLQMLDEATFALLILTGEDELNDGSFNPRMNVIHEAGLFQGRLGFTRAIVLLEEGCTEFSNINGLGQLRFPKNNIRAAFHEVREVLMREGILPS